MSTGLRRRHILLTAGIALLLGACSGTSAPAATSAPNGAASAPSDQVSAPSAAAAPNAAVPNAAAPSAPASSAAAAGPADACALLTRAEVEAAFGESMLAPVSSVDQGDATCTWMHEAAGLDLTVQISSQPSSAAGLKSAEAIYGAAATVVPGVGDGAFEAVGVLEFVKGTTLVIIGTGDGPGIISDDHFRGLAKLAAGRA